MFKLIVLVLVLAGWFGVSSAFFPGVWNNMSWCLPMTNVHGSWGMIVGVVLVYMTHKAVK